MIRKLPEDIKDVLDTYLDGLIQILNKNLYGFYIYGASVFPDSGPIQDIDCHVIIREELNKSERADLMEVYKDLAVKYPYWGAELDAYVILLDDAKSHEIPQHQVLPAIYDQAWALHCAHIRAGFYRTLWGLEPDEIFPEPTWEAVDIALQHEIQYVIDHPQYPAYCILNLCRILYSYTELNPVISKQYSATWGSEQFPQWDKLIRAARKFYRKTNNTEDDSLMAEKLEEFLAFMILKIENLRKM